MSLTWLPNAITLLRCGCAILAGWLILAEPRQSWLPVLAFILVASTDFLDGWLARRLNAVSPLGAFLDPVADKLLVGASLVALALLEAGAWLILIPTGVIIARDLIATILRLFPKIEMPVSRLAKWKTAIEMFAITALLVTGPLELPPIWQVGLVFLWAATALSVYTLGLYVGAVIGNEKRPR